MTDASRGIPHRIKSISVFDAIPRTEDALATGIPKISVVEPKIMSEFVCRNSGAAKGILDPCPGSADKTQATEIKSGDILEAKEVIVVGI